MRKQGLMLNPALPLSEQAEKLIQEQFGREPKWAWINQALWQHFESKSGKRLGLSGIKLIASSLGVSIDEVLSVISLLTGTAPFIFEVCLLPSFGS